MLLRSPAEEQALVAVRPRAVPHGFVSQKPKADILLPVQVIRGSLQTETRDTAQEAIG